MQRTKEHQEQQGFLTIAQNSGSIDYLKMAYVQAMSIKLTMPNSRYAVIVDAATSQQITDQHRKVFDYIIDLPQDFAANQEWKLNNEWQVFWLTPFKETIKLEADMLIPRSIEHWWNAFRLRDVVLSTGARNYLDEISTARHYREAFDANGLPDVYNGLMYFRYSKTAAQFFALARAVFLNWPAVARELTKVPDTAANTDMAYAVVCRILGEENTTIPSADFINFVHMKPAINGWPEPTEFHKGMNVIIEPPRIRVNNVEQYHPFHYHYKDFITDEIVKEYERVLGI